MRGCPHLVKAFFLSQLREPVGFFFLLVFGPVLVTVLGLIFGNDPRQEFGGAGFMDSALPGFILMSPLIAGAVTVPQNQLLLRTSGVLTRLRVTPLKPRTFVAADLTVHLVLGMVGALLTFATGVLLFRVPPPQNGLGVLAAVLLGLVAMLALGYVLAAVYPSVGAATGVGNVVMILLMISSGSFFPVEGLSSGVRTAMQASPSFHMTQLVDASWESQAWDPASVVVLLGMAAVFGVLGTVLFRWDRTR